ncbi:hypothetical protein [Anatilimnocola floriformis]|uniref:hypothetical protein n=1 Tax=Anatilimnocola floriformis TaxID=2948575 RepID=UPI0020C4199F|nr:hypothetical protein [Anatilimnocola floriformis]
MKFHVVSTLSFFGRTKAIDAIHASFFHGTADRGGKRPNSQNSQLANAVDRPLQLHKNIFEIADVFSPEFKLVVSAKVRDVFHDLPEVAFAPVHFKTLYEIPFRAGDFSFYKTIGDFFAIERFIDRQVDKPALHEKIGDYFELVAPPVRDFAARYPLITASVDIGELDDLTEILICPQLLNDVPIYSQGKLVMSDAAYRRLSPFINWTYYLHGEGDV